MGKPKKNDSNYYKPNVWRFLTDVFTAAIARGQLPALLLGITALVLVCKIDSSSASDLLHRLLSTYELHYIFGWGLSVLLAFGWFLSAKQTRRIHAAEMDRVAKEKTELQNLIHGAKLPSTRTPRKNNNG